MNLPLPFPLTIAALDALCAPWVCGYGSNARHIASLEALGNSRELTGGMGLHPQNAALGSFQVYIAPPCPGQVCIGECLQRQWWCVTVPIAALFPAEADLRQFLGTPTLTGTELPSRWLIYEYAQYTLVFEASRERLTSCLYYPKALWEQKKALFPKGGQPMEPT